jgi:hypothetical protein
LSSPYFAWELGKWTSGGAHAQLSSQLSQRHGDLTAPPPLTVIYTAIGAPTWDIDIRKSKTHRSPMKANNHPTTGNSSFVGMFPAPGRWDPGGGHGTQRPDPWPVASRVANGGRRNNVGSGGVGKPLGSRLNRISSWRSIPGFPSGFQQVVATRIRPDMSHNISSYISFCKVPGPPHCPRSTDEEYVACGPTSWPGVDTRTPERE